MAKFKGIPSLNNISFVKKAYFKFSLWDEQQLDLYLYGYRKKNHFYLIY